MLRYRVENTKAQRVNIKIYILVIVCPEDLEDGFQNYFQTVTRRREHLTDCLRAMPYWSIQFNVKSQQV